ncbi:MAG: carbamoyltransferase HypF, partial [Candidatus Odinarchaeia archaeon]
YILCIKGNGGFHFATSTIKSEPLIKLRKRKNRPYKPFAIMAPNIKTIKTFANVSKFEEELLKSYIRPIILLEKNENYYLSEYVAPTLHNIGVMLPYTGLHYLLFENTKEPAFVMTSANPQDEPIAITNEGAISKLGKFVDYFLLYNRKINQRCDDSVVRFHNSTPLLIRRSRGYAPKPIELKWLKSNKKTILGTGGEENVTFCILNGNKAFLSQYIGKTQKYETFNYYKTSIEYFKTLLNVDFDEVITDLHQGFNTTLYGKVLAEENSIPLKMIQHHYAHFAALLGENKLNNMVGLIIDGFGLGEDGEAWGGEVIHFNPKYGFKRLAHIKEYPLPGGDAATKYPLRIAMGFLKEEKGFEKWITQHKKYFPYGEQEIKVVNRILESGKYIRTSSAGRYLDAISSILGICFKRTYEGEPAIRLESAGIKGKDVLMIDPIIIGDKLDVSEVVKIIFNKKEEFSRKNLAYSAMSYLANGLSELSIKIANNMNTNIIGISGGVAYNKIIVDIIKKRLEASGYTFIEHKMVPPGDGGLSFGQVIGDLILYESEIWETL